MFASGRTMREEGDKEDKDKANGEKETKRKRQRGLEDYIYGVVCGGVIWGNDKQLQRLCLMIDMRLDATNIEVGDVVAATTK